MKTLILVTVCFASLYLSIQVASAQGGVIDAPRDAIHPKEHVVNQKAVPYQYLREANVMWEKRIWRTIDFREKINHVFYYPLQPANGRKSFMFVIMDAMKEGTITPYQINGTGVNDEFLVPLTPDEVTSSLNKSITRRIQRAEPPYDEFDTTITITFEPSNVKLLRVKEDWFIDRERSLMEIRILGLCPVIEQFDEATGEYKGQKPLFWIYFNEARPLFAKNEIFNRQNAAERRTFDDIFFKRMFNSIIYKEENVFDRKINEYMLKGIDQLLESDRIKNDIAKMEMDLWEY